MRKKDLEKLNAALSEQADVPDGVLDKARAELQRRQAVSSAPSPSFAQPEKRRGARAGGVLVANRGAVVFGCACAAVMLCLAIALVFLSRGGEFYGGKSYRLADLSASEISSVADYNAENGTDYLCLTSAPSSAALYADGDTPVLFEERFTYGGTECVWYVLVDQRDAVDVLSPFEDLSAQADINGYTVYYASAAEGQYAELYGGESRYCLFAQTDDAGELLVMLQNIFI